MRKISRLDLIWRLIIVQGGDCINFSRLVKICQRLIDAIKVKDWLKIFEDLATKIKVSKFQDLLNTFKIWFKE